MDVGGVLETEILRFKIGLIFEVHVGEWMQGLRSSALF
jgi:hypothetical protein